MFEIKWSKFPKKSISVGFDLKFRQGWFLERESKKCHKP